MSTADKQREEQRDSQHPNLIPFKPGQSGNPAGRPKKGDALADIIAKIMKQTEEKFAFQPGKVSRRKVGELMVRRFVAVALYDNDRRVALMAAQWLADRQFGKPRQGTDISFEEGLLGPIILPVWGGNVKDAGPPDNAD